MKVSIMAYFRFKRRCPYVASEVDTGFLPRRADVLVGDQKMTKVVEIEVKLNKADLHADFKKKNWKHKYYKNGGHIGPTHFYFAFPSNVNFLSDGIIPREYGVIIVDPGKYWLKDDLSVGTCRIIKRAKKLPNDCQMELMLWSILKRMASESIHLKAEKEAGIWSRNEIPR